MKTTIVPRDISGFNAYVNDSTNYLLGVSVPPTAATGGALTAADAASIAVVPAPNYLRLGMSDTEMNQWRSYRDQWNALYPKYTLKDELRTTAIKNKLRTVLRNFVVFSTPRLRRMSGSENATEDDAAALRFVIVRKKPKHHGTQITDVPMLSLSPLGGGDVKFRVRPTTDTKRASKIAGADIEIRYQTTLLEEPAPLQIDELTKDLISSKATFIVHLGTQSQSKILYAACRWVVINDPSRNGPWSGIDKCVIA